MCKVPFYGIAFLRFVFTGTQGINAVAQKLGVPLSPSVIVDSQRDSDSYCTDSHPPLPGTRCCPALPGVRCSVRHGDDASYHDVSPPQLGVGDLESSQRRIIGDLGYFPARGFSSSQGLGRFSSSGHATFEMERLMPPGQSGVLLFNLALGRDISMVMRLLSWTPHLHGVLDNYPRPSGRTPFWHQEGFAYHSLNRGPVREGNSWWRNGRPVEFRFWAAPGSCTTYRLDGEILQIAMQTAGRFLWRSRCHRFVPSTNVVKRQIGALFIHFDVVCII